MRTNILFQHFNPWWRIRRPCRQLTSLPRQRRPRQVAKSDPVPIHERFVDVAQLCEDLRGPWVPREPRVSSVPTPADLDEMIASLPWPDV
jgi:hypothetical protein